MEKVIFVQYVKFFNCFKEVCGNEMMYVNEVIVVK